jgi:hypothetical protein
VGDQGGQRLLSSSRLGRVGPGHKMTDPPSHDPMLQLVSTATGGTPIEDSRWL